VLRTLRKTAMDGYSLQSAAQVDAASLVRAVQTLISREWITVVGDTSANEIGRAFMRVPLQARGRVEEFLRNPEIAEAETKR